MVVVVVVVVVVVEVVVVLVVEVVEVVEVDGVVEVVVVDGVDVVVVVAGVVVELLVGDVLVLVVEWWCVVVDGPGVVVVGPVVGLDVGAVVVGGTVVFTGPLLTVAPVTGVTGAVDVATRSSKLDQSKIPAPVDGDRFVGASVVALNATGGVVSGVLASHHWSPKEIPESTKAKKPTIIRPDKKRQVQMLFQIEVRGLTDWSSARMRATRRASSSGSSRLRSLGPDTGQNLS